MGEEPPGLRGRALQIYLLLVSEGKPMGVRDIQARLSLSSPSVAHYHLRKLEEMGLVTRDPGGRYYARRLIKAGALREFLFLGSLALPRHVLYSALFLALLVFCAVALSSTSDVGLLVITLASLALASFSWLYEGLRVLRRLPEQ